MLSSFQLISIITESIVSFSLIAVVFVAPFFIPVVRQWLVSYYERNFAAIVNVLIDLSKPEAEKALQFGKKFATLLGGWFALLFVVELALRVALLLLAVCVRGVRGLFAQKSTAETQSEGEKEKTE